jgi:hypothetical protein
MVKALSSELSAALILRSTGERRFATPSCGKIVFSYRWHGVAAFIFHAKQLSQILNSVIGPKIT